MSPELQADSSIAVFPGGSDGHESAYNASACSAGDPSSIPDPLEKGMATHASILAWTISWAEEPGKATDHNVAKRWTLSGWQDSCSRTGLSFISGGRSAICASWGLGVGAPCKGGKAGGRNRRWLQADGGPWASTQPLPGLSFGPQGLSAMKYD